MESKTHSYSKHIAYLKRCHQANSTIVTSIIRGEVYIVFASNTYCCLFRNAKIQHIFIENER